MSPDGAGSGGDSAARIVEMIVTELDSIPFTEEIRIVRYSPTVNKKA